MSRFTLQNKFHGVRAQVTINTEPGLYLTDSQVKKVKRALCGMSDCLCGGINAYPRTANDKFVLVHQDDSRGWTDYWLESV